MKWILLTMIATTGCVSFVPDNTPSVPMRAVELQLHEHRFGVERQYVDSYYCAEGVLIVSSTGRLGPVDLKCESIYQ
jgi:hypothetical protein